MEYEIIKFISLHQDIPEDAIQPSSHLVNDLGLTSLDIMHLVYAMEERYEIEVEEEEMINLLTVEKIAKFIEAQMAPKNKESSENEAAI